MSDELAEAQYVSFVSYKRDGSPVPTAVWVVEFDGGWAFTTGADSFKVKRIRRNPEVTITPCSVRGKVTPGATVFSGTAELLDAANTARVEAAIKAKYRFVYLLVISPGNLWARLRGREPSAGNAAIKVTLTA